MQKIVQKTKRQHCSVHNYSTLTMPIKITAQIKKRKSKETQKSGKQQRQTCCYATRARTLPHTARIPANTSRPDSIQTHIYEPHTYACTFLRSWYRSLFRNWSLCNIQLHPLKLEDFATPKRNAILQCMKVSWCRVANIASLVSRFLP